MNDNMDFEAYIRQGEPDKKEKASIWQTAIGLQAVDGKTVREPDDDEKQEADKVSANITKILSSKTFDFSTNGLVSLHRRITSAPMDLCLCIVAFSKAYLSMQVRFVSMILLKRNGCWKVIR